MAGTITALVGCQVQACAEEVSHHLDMVRMYKGAPMCEECYLDLSLPIEEDDSDDDRWFNLPEITLGDLKE